MVTVDMGRGAVQVPPGGVLAFGRNADDGLIGADDRRVSRHHGDIIAGEGGTWSLTSHGGVVVYDHETPSRLHVPRGIGPVTIPFAKATVIIELRDTRHAFTVTSSGLPGWDGSWASVAAARVPTPAGPDATELAWEPAFGRSRKNQPVRWYQALVALCEPTLRGDGAAVPTDAQVARRIDVSTVRAGRLVTQARDALGFEPRTANLRQAMVALSIGQGLVTPRELRVLDREAVDD